MSSTFLAQSPAAGSARDEDRGPGLGVSPATGEIDVTAEAAGTDEPGTSGGAGERAWLRATARVPAPATALFDGVVDGEQLLVSVPVQQVATVDLRGRPSGRTLCRSDQFGTGSVVERALDVFAARAGEDAGWEVSLDVRTMVPERAPYRGHAARLAAAAACAAALGVDTDPGELTALVAAAGRPVTSAAFVGFAAVRAGDGSLVQHWPFPARFAVVLLYPTQPGTGAPLDPLDGADAAPVWQQLAAGLGAGDVAQVAAAASRAAGWFAQQDPAGAAATALAEAPSVGALGVAAGADGTAALLFDGALGRRQVASAAWWALTPRLRERFWADMTTTVPAA